MHSPLSRSASYFSAGDTDAHPLLAQHMCYRPSSAARNCLQRAQLSSASAALSGAHLALAGHFLQQLQPPCAAHAAPCWRLHPHQTATAPAAPSGKARGRQRRQLLLLRPPCRRRVLCARVLQQQWRLQVGQEHCEAPAAGADAGREGCCKALRQHQSGMHQHLGLRTGPGAVQGACAKERQSSCTPHIPPQTCRHNLSLPPWPPWPDLSRLCRLVLTCSSRGP